MKANGSLAFVVPRCGHDVVGGAESHCLMLAEHLAQRMRVEILTTCAQDYMTWKNAFKPGTQRHGNLIIRRFPVAAPRNVIAFDCMSMILQEQTGTAPLGLQEAWMRAQGPRSPGLSRYLAMHGHTYRNIIFIPYQYATTYFNLPLVQERAILAPLAHDDWCIQFSMWDHIFALPRTFFFNTPEEQSLLSRRFPCTELNGTVVGVGIDPPSDVSAIRFRQKSNVNDPFVLYLGRVDPSKGCLDLISHFLELKQAGYRGKLLLLGKAWMSIPKHPDIIALGFVEEQAKWDALAAADWLIMPSPYESLSLVMLESWAVGTPTLCRAGCDVLMGQTRRAQGGLWYDGAQEFIAVLTTIPDSVRRRLGNQGQRYVQKEYAWSKILQTCHKLLDRLVPRDAPRNHVQPDPGGINK